MEFDQENIAFQKTIDLINNTDYPIFLNGKAGTGKTTFLRSLKEYTYKNIVVVAPTGVAAINANGLTIHSFFQLPITLMNPENVNFLSSIRFSAEKKKLLNEIDLLIIDEISMVRGDLLDAIDKLLRNLRNKESLPFGGIQVLYIGDLYQLSPIAKDNDIDELKKWYTSPYFFDSNVFQESNPVCIELEKVYRQSDPEFVGLLNSIRDNTINDEQLDLLNRQVCSDLNMKKEGYIFLTTHNRKVDELNAFMLRQLPGQEHFFTALISGKFEEMLYPAEYKLHLKIGAQLMLLKNDKGKERKYFNGKIGVLEKIENDKLFIRFEDNQLFEIEKEVWRNIDYKYDESHSAILENDIGAFQQFPVRLAWAITVHKSQGLTFEKAIVDVGEAFLPGQVYVALSRVSSFHGLALHSKINRPSINVDSRVHAFCLTNHAKELTDDFLLKEESNFIQKTILKYFDWSSITGLTKTGLVDTIDFLVPYFEIIDSQKGIAKRFGNEIMEILNAKESQNKKHLDIRITAAVQYFTLEISNKLLIPLKALLKESRKNLNFKKYSTLLQGLVTILDKKITELADLTLISRDLEFSQKIGPILNEVKKKQLSKVSKKTNIVTSKKGLHVAEKEQGTILTLFSSGKSVQEIAAIKKLSVSAIEFQLAAFIESGEINILDIVSQKQLDFVMSILDGQDDQSVTKIKQKVGDNISFGQVNAVITYKKSNLT